MHKYIIILSFFFICTTEAQSNFVKAKITKDTGEELQVHLGLYNWLKVPDVIKYKTEEDGKLLKLDRNEVSKIEIVDGYTYIKTTVHIDKSILINTKYDDSKKIEYASKVLFLRLLVEGEASLYDNFRFKRPLYFFKTKEEAIAQLVYKPYLTDNAKIDYNRGYIYQLTENLRCENVYFGNAEFSKKILVNYFKEYNACVQSEYVDHTAKKSKDKLIGFNVVAGFDSNQLDYIQNERITFPFESNISPRFGVEMDFHLPINSRNRWIAYLGSSLRFYEGQSEVVNRTAYNVKYTFAELTSGVRYILNVFKNGGVLLEGGYALQITYQEDISSATDLPTGLDGQSVFPFLSTGFSLGTGIQFSKNMLQLRLYFPSDIDGNLGFASNLNTFSLMYSRKLF